MSKHDEDYQEERESSQVRSIIRQLNEETPAKEKNREVVVRPDGTKVVRVTKKRKVMITQAEHRRRSRRSFMFAVVAILALLGVFVAFFSVRMSAMSGETYLAEREQELCRLWGASSVTCTGASIDGVNLRIAGIVAEFPETCMVERVELSQVEGMLDFATFFTGVLTGDDLNIGRIRIRLRDNAREMHLPQQAGEPLWQFRRFLCQDFSISHGNENTAPWSVEHSTAYMYHPQEGSTVVTLDGGVLRLKGWKEIHIKEGKFLFSPLSLEEFSLSGTADTPRAGEQPRSSLTLSGRLQDGYALTGPYELVANNMNLTDFTSGRFNQFFRGTVVPSSDRKALPTARISLPLDTPRPQFSGLFNLKSVSLSAFPAIRMFCEHIDPAKRKRYLPPAILHGAVRLEQEGDSITMSFDESDMEERDLISLRGRISVNGANELSGTLDYGLPAILTHVEYPDGVSDPIFTDDSQTAWLCTRVSGAANYPEDNATEIEARAAIARKDRPARTPFQDIDLDRLSEQMNSGDAQGLDPMETTDPLDGGQTPATTPTTVPDFDQDSGPRLRLDDDDPFASPF